MNRAKSASDLQRINEYKTPAKPSLKTVASSMTLTSAATVTPQASGLRNALSSARTPQSAVQRTGMSQAQTPAVVTPEMMAEVVRLALTEKRKVHALRFSLF